MLSCRSPGYARFFLDHYEWMTPEDELKMDARAIEDLLYKQSGLLGMSGLSGDMRMLLASDAPRARFAPGKAIRIIGRDRTIDCQTSVEIGKCEARTVCA